MHAFEADAEDKQNMATNARGVTHTVSHEMTPGSMLVEGKEDKILQHPNQKMSKVVHSYSSIGC